MTTRLTLIRHGASQHKVDGVAGGPRGCRGLTPAGRLQAERLAQRLAGELKEGPDAIYCSVIPRAIETANILAVTWGSIDVVQDCGLCSWHISAHADGKLWTAYQAEFGIAGGGVFRPFEDGSESWSELVGRTGRAMEQIAARHKHRTVVIVTHAEPIASSMIVFGGLPLAPAFDMSAAPDSITEWKTEGDPDAWPRPRWTLVRLNDSAHVTAAVG